MEAPVTILRKILDRGKRISLPVGNVLYRNGEQVSRLIFVWSGKLRIENLGKTIEEIEQDQFFGISELMTEGNIKGNVITDAESELILVEKDALSEIMQEPELRFYMITLMSRRLLSVRPSFE